MGFLTKKKTIDGVLAVARGVVTDLRDLQQEHDARCAELNDEITALMAERTEQADEADRAGNLADKWEDLVSEGRFLRTSYL